MIPNGQKGKRIFKRLRLSESRRCCDFFPSVFGVWVPVSALSKLWAFSGQVRN